MTLLPAGDWADVHGRAVDTFLPALDALRVGWSLPGAAWERLPGGEDCAAFSLGADLVVKLVPPGSEGAVAREVSLLARVGPAGTARPRRTGSIATSPRRAHRSCSTGT